LLKKEVVEGISAIATAAARARTGSVSDWKQRMKNNPAAKKRHETGKAAYWKSKGMKNPTKQDSISRYWKAKLNKQVSDKSK
jgi:hypothetical protein